MPFPVIQAGQVPESSDSFLALSPSYDLTPHAIGKAVTHSRPDTWPHFPVILPVRKLALAGIIS